MSSLTQPASGSLWRMIVAADYALVRISGRLRITGSISADIKNRPFLLVSNHIGNLDPLVLIAASRTFGIAPRFLLAGGLLDAPLLGPLLKACGHVRVDRSAHNVGEAFHRAALALRDNSGPLALYPEGRISLDPGLWPERGKTGAARLALQTGVPVIPVSQWGAHESMYWGTARVSSWSDLSPYASSYLKSLRKRPVLKVHFGQPIDLSDLESTQPRHTQIAHTRIMRAITAGLVELRADELDKPRFNDPTRPTTGSSPWWPLTPE